MHSISGSTASHSDDQLIYGADRMELEAAEALAGLAQVSTRESSESGTTKWRGKGKRARGRVKSESPQTDSPDLALNSSNYHATTEYDRVEGMDIHAGYKKAKIKQQTKVLSPSLMCDASTMPFGVSRSRKNLTEAEKEEKRLRRVLANRESARQTIRRRQALHEELSRKASDLSVENADLKREKELALEKLHSLKNANGLLKLQMYQSVNPVIEENLLRVVENVRPKVEENLLQMPLNIKSEVEESLELKLAHPGASSSKNTSRLYCNDNRMKHSQLTPCLLRPVVQPLSLDQTALMPCVAMPTAVPMFSSGPNSSETKHYTTSSPLTPVYMLSYPWFLPVPYNHDGEVHHKSSSAAAAAAENDKCNTNAASSPCNGSLSSNIGTIVENHHSTLPFKAEPEVSGSKENGPGTCTSETPLLHMINGNNAGAFGGHASESIHIQPPNNSDPALVLSNAKPDRWVLLDSQMNKETSFFLPIKMTEHSVAAAEARKRRKELTKFKNFTGRRYRLPC